MNASHILLVAVAALAATSCGTALGVPDGPFSLSGSGYAVMPDGIEPTSLNLNITPSAASADADLTVTSGTLTYNMAELDGSSIAASFLREAKFISIEGLAERNNSSVIVNLLGRLVEEKGGESLYMMTGTLRSGDHEGKAVFAASLSQSGAMTVAAEPVADPLGVVILPDPRNEGDPQGHIDRTSIQTLVGQSVTITNKDTIPHRFVSGSLNEWLYERDGSPRVCDSDGSPDEDAPEVQTQTTTSLHSGESISVTVPEPQEHRLPTSSHRAYGCDFTRDGITDITLAPGASASVSAPELGYYRLLDVTSPWIQLEIISLLEIRES